MTARLREVAVLKLVFPGEEIGSSRELWLTFLLDGRQSIEVDLAVVNNLGSEIFVSGKAVFRDERRQVFGRALSTRCRRVRRGYATGFDAFHGGFGNLVGVFADFVFDVVAIFVDVVGPDFTAVLQVDNVGKCVGAHAGCQQEQHR